MRSALDHLLGRFRIKHHGRRLVQITITRQIIQNLPGVNVFGIFVNDVKLRMQFLRITDQLIGIVGGKHLITVFFQQALVTAVRFAAVVNHKDAPRLFHVPVPFGNE